MRIFIFVVVAVAAAVGIFVAIRQDVTGEKGSGLGPAYEYDVRELAKVDPNLILYKESGRGFGTGFEASQAIAVSSQGRIYVVGDKAIRIFERGGDLVGEMALGDRPRCLALAGDGRIYVGMRDHIEIYDAQGRRQAAWAGLGDDAVLTSIAVGRDDVFAADAGNRIVMHYDTSGKLINRIGAKDKERNIPGFVVPSPYFDIAIAPDGLLRVVDPGRLRMEAYTFDGDLELSWGEFSPRVDGFTGCCNPVNFALLSDGSFVTCEKGLVRVKIYDPGGKFVGVVAASDQLVEGPVSICYFPDQCQAGGFDVAVDSAGRVFVLDTVKNVVRVFERKAG